MEAVQQRVLKEVSEMMSARAEGLETAPPSQPSRQSPGSLGSAVPSEVFDFEEGGTGNSAARPSIGTLEALAALSGRTAALEESLSQASRSRQQDRDKAQLQDLADRLASVEERSLGGLPPGSIMSDSQIKAELERQRKLLECIRNVLPQDAQEAMSFFNSGPSGHKKPSPEEEKTSMAVAQGLDCMSLLHQLKKLEERVGSSNTDLQRELANLSTVVKALQRDVDSGRHRVETPVPKGDFSHLLNREREGTPMSLVSKRVLQQAIDGLKEDMRCWVDSMHTSVLGALQQKADAYQLAEIARHAGSLPSESDVAAFARRALLGRCASCDTPLSAEALTWQRPSPSLSLGKFPSDGISGAKVTIRPPASRQGDASKLPRLAFSPVKPIPKSKVLRGSASEPALRQPSRADNHLDSAGSAQTETS